MHTTSLTALICHQVTSSATLVLLETSKSPGHVQRVSTVSTPLTKLNAQFSSPQKGRFTISHSQLQWKVHRGKPMCLFFHHHYLCEQPLSMKLFMGITELSWENLYCSLQCDLHSARNCVIRLFIRHVIYQKKAPKHQKSTTELL